MGQFFKFVFASMLGMLVAIFVSVFIFIGIVAVSVSSLDEKKSVTVEQNTVLKISLSTPIVDRTPNDPLQNFDFEAMEPNRMLGLNTILESIQKAKGDKKIKGIYLNLEEISAGMSTIREIREALLSFKEDSDKFIVCYSEMISQKAYYLGSVADEVILNPEGYIQLTGLSATIPFFKGTLEKLDVEAQIIRHGKFKSAVEPFMLDKMSEANREQTSRFVNSIWDNMIVDITASRDMSVGEFNRIIDTLDVGSAGDALQFGIVDKLMFYDEFIVSLKERLGLEEDKEITFMSLTKYENAPKTKKESKGVIRDRIAVIYAQGGIVSGEGDPDQIGSTTISAAIRNARKDKKVKAIVLRVNSGGGSALASDIILREMDLARQVKPVIASMGDVAASGGYYISCFADTIVASSTTITGSIGVLGILLNMKEFYSNKLGITFDRVRTNEHSDIGSPTRPLTPMEKQKIQEEVERIYDVFIDHVAEGRGMTKADVDSIGQGRVWSGEDALELGLIDVLGGLEDAIEIAAEMAGLEEYRIKELPKQKDAFEEILAELTGAVRLSMMKYELGDSYIYYEQLKKLTRMKGIQMIVPYSLELN